MVLTTFARQMNILRNVDFVKTKCRLVKCDTGSLKFRGFSLQGRIHALIDPYQTY